MSSDWIKMRSDLYRDPKVILMAQQLANSEELQDYVNQWMQRDICVTSNVTRHTVVGALVSIWGIARHCGARIGDDLILRQATLLAIDEMSDLPGIGQCMEYVGWAVCNEEGVVFPNFFEHNVDPSDAKRLKATERKQKQRKKERDTRRDNRCDTKRDMECDSHADVTHREEKRRVENNPLPPKGGDGDFFSEFWKIYPKKQNRPAAERAWARLGLTADQVATVLGHLRHRSRHDPEWLREDGRFIPTPSRFLSGRRFEDEIIPPAAAEPMVHVSGTLKIRDDGDLK